MFIGREAELKRLEKMYSSNKLEFKKSRKDNINQSFHFRS